VSELRAGSARILVGDCRERLADLADESVHACITSPPYWGLRDYGVAGQIGLNPEYAAMAAARIGRDAPLFAGAAA
jgi:DNA modification methylase